MLSSVEKYWTAQRKYDEDLRSCPKNTAPFFILQLKRQTLSCFGLEMKGNQPKKNDDSLVLRLQGRGVTSEECTGQACRWPSASRGTWDSDPPGFCFFSPHLLYLSPSSCLLGAVQRLNCQLIPSLTTWNLHQFPRGELWVDPAWVNQLKPREQDCSTRTAYL